VGCPDLASRAYRDRTIRICGLSGTTFRQALQCPKLTTRPGSAQIFPEAITSDFN
jgi:hypothetical protein